MSYPPQGVTGGGGGSSLTISETQAYSGVISSGLWRNVDLSSVVGVNKAVVLIKVGCQNVAQGLSIAFRREGDTDECYKAGFETNGVAYATAGKNNEFYFRALVETDSNGVIEVQTSAGVTITIDVLAFWTS